VKKIAEHYGLKPCKIEGTDVVNIRKTPSDKYKDIGWDDFERLLKKRGLAVYKATESDFLKIMKVK
jgi:ribosomal protein S10